jgi:hypothetical protein
MGNNDTLKTAKISIAAEDMSSDGYQDRHVRKARRKERQKGKQIIRKELNEVGAHKKRGKLK